MTAGKQQAPWRRILEGGPAETAWDAIHAVTADLERRFEPEDATLNSGAAGWALYFAYLAEALEEERYAERAVELLEDAIDALESSAMPAHLYAGFVGVGWVVEHLEGRLFESEGEDEDDNEIDDALASLLEGPGWRGDYDLIGGLAGYGAYALEALPRPSARRCLELVVAKLEEIAVPRGSGRTWFTPPELMTAAQRRAWPEGFYNLGVAHGVPGVIAVLARAAAAGVATRRATALVRDAVGWLLAQELPAGAGSCFASSVADGIEARATRLAWCYGDAGVAAALLLAARALGRADWEHEALRVARIAASRPPESAGVTDAGLCHGAAGLGHLFNRLYQASGDGDLARAARSWFGRALELRQPGEGVGGFLAGPFDHGDWLAAPGFLIGGGGVALALLGAVSDIEPEWDRALLMSAPAPLGADGLPIAADTGN